MTNFPFEETLTEVRRPSLIDNATTVELDGNHYSVPRTPKRGLTPVDLALDGNEIPGFTQNPTSKLSGRNWRDPTKRSCRF